ncbi:MAG TPA: energy transducer TonB [Pseudomonadales bacterium]|nr:energy transducer TonB [Pseudomonadales bacterium]
MRQIRFLCALAAAALTTGYTAASHATEYDELGCGSGFGPVEQQAPVYPQRAASRRIEGYIVMGFTIAADGSVRDVEVVEQDPVNTFVRTATRAVGSLKFPPCVIDGAATEKHAVSIRYNFALN